VQFVEPQELRSMSSGVLGRIRAATLVCPNLDVAISSYRDYLGYRELERGEISAALADLWGARRMTGSRYALLQPKSGADTWLRFVEIPDNPAYKPYSSWGWNALELTVQNCDEAVATLSQGPFEIVGPAHDLGFSDGALRAGQVVGPFGEVLYLTEIKRPVPGFSLPSAASPIDRIFIVILHGADADQGIAAYGQQFGNGGSPTFETSVDFMALYQGLPADHPYRLGTVAMAPGFYLEIDGAPAHIGKRPVPTGLLPSGIAMLSIETTERRPAARSVDAGALYTHRRAERIEGPFGEWIELLTVDAAV
jgi:catechol 2,3-dioxygenase-like lactoylglutathione lyase family enzyme